jgi:hypothetical protein
MIFDTIRPKVKREINKVPLNKVEKREILKILCIRLKFNSPPFSHYKTIGRTEKRVHYLYNIYFNLLNSVIFKVFNSDITQLCISDTQK